jgi:hypothetical protein
LNKARPKIKPDPKEVIYISSLPGSPPRKKAKIVREASPGTEKSDTPLSSPPQSPRTSSAAAMPRKSTGLSKEASTDFKNAIMTAGKDGGKKKGDVAISDTAIELLKGWLSSSRASTTMQDTPPRTTRSGAQKRKAGAI